jgi:hypothetical protein
MTTRAAEERTPTEGHDFSSLQPLDVHHAPAEARTGHSDRDRHTTSGTPAPPRLVRDAEAGADLGLRKQGRGRDALAIANLTMALRDVTRAGIELSRAEVQLARARVRLDLCVRAASRK